MRKWLKPEIVLLASGVLFSLALSFCLFAYYVIPGYTIPRTALEAKTLWWLKPLGTDNEKLIYFGLPALGLFYLIFCAAFLRNVSDNFTFRRLRSIKGAVLGLLALFFLAASFALPIISDIEGIDYELPQFFYYLNTLMLKYLVPVLGFAITWLIAGAGRSPARWKRRLSDIFIGAIAGSCVTLFFYLGDVAYTITSVAYYVNHGKPYEFNPYIFNLSLTNTFLNHLLVVMGSIGIAMAVSFGNLSKKARIKWTSLSVIFCAVLFIFSGIVYLDSRDEFNEYKIPFADNTGISTEAQPPWEMIVLTDKTGQTVKWPAELLYMNPLETSENGMKKFEMYPATNENLRKLSEYIERSNVGLARSEYVLALVNGYFTLWDEKMARATLVQYADDFTINRMFSQSLFAFIPTTEENKELLRQMAQGTKWNNDAVTAHRFCRMYKYMDIAHEGEKWCSIVSDAWGEEPEVRDFTLVNGTLKGRVLLNAAPMQNGKIVLLREMRDFGYELENRTTMLIKLMASSPPGPNGDFEFTGLKAGEYLDYELAVVFDHPLEYEVVGIDNPPGIINVTSAEKDFDVGVINIRTSKQ